MDYKEKSKKYDSIIENLNNKLDGLVGRLEKDIDKFNHKNMPVSSASPPPCGSIKRNPFTPGEDLTADELRDLKDVDESIDNIIEELASNKIKFPDSNSVVPEEPNPPGRGQRGDKAGVYELPFFGTPPWMDEIEAGIGKMFSEPTIMRKGIDYESAQTYLPQGIFVSRKSKFKTLKENKEIYIILDQSYSMEMYKYKGYNFLELLGSFVPELAEKYDGEFWGCDVCSVEDFESDEKSVPTVRKSLESVRKQFVRQLPLKGGGSTEFGGAFMKIKGIELKKQEEDPDSEVCVLFFSDMELMDSDWANIRKYSPKRVMYILPKNMENRIQPQLGWINANPDNRVLLIDIEKE